MPKKRRLPDPNKKKPKAKPRNLRPFHQFSRLPAELQSKIWAVAEPEPRLIKLRVHCFKTKRGESYEQVRSLAPGPVLLQICRESRYVTLKRGLYRRAFIRDQPLRGQQHFTWINFETDMFFYSRGEPLFTAYFGPETPLVERFRMETTCGMIFSQLLSPALQKFVSLKELEIISLDTLACWRRTLEDVYFPLQAKITFIRKEADGETRLSVQDIIDRWDSPYREVNDEDVIIVA